MCNEDLPRVSFGKSKQFEMESFLDIRALIPLKGCLYLEFIVFCLKQFSSVQS